MKRGGSPGRGRSPGGRSKPGVSCAAVVRRLSSIERCFVSGVRRSTISSGA